MRNFDKNKARISSKFALITFAQYCMCALAHERVNWSVPFDFGLYRGGGWTDGRTAGRTDGQMYGCRVMSCPKFLASMGYHIFLAMVLCAPHLWHAQSSANNFLINIRDPVGWLLTANRKQKIISNFVPEEW